LKVKIKKTQKLEQKNIYNLSVPRLDYYKTFYNIQIEKAEISLVV